MTEMYNGNVNGNVNGYYPQLYDHSVFPDSSNYPYGMVNHPTQMLMGGKPEIEIVEQPRARGLRFRYKCEGRSAGTIPGEQSNNEQRTYPTIRIKNHHGSSAIVVVSCVTKDDPPRPHPHSLVGKDCKQGVCTVKLKGTNQVTFPSLGIQCATKKEVQDALKLREKIRVDPWGTGYYKNINSVELSTVRLAFQAFLPDENGKYTRIVPPAVSQCIYDKKAVTDLVICRLSRQSGFAKGGDEVFLLCEKVNKDDIQVRFYEETDEDGIVWEKYGSFGQQDVHRQVAIVFKTPEYRNQNITTPVNVMVQLRRPSDDEISESKAFQFVPNEQDPDCVRRKKESKKMKFDTFLKDIDVPSNFQPYNDGTMSPRQQIRERIIRKKARYNNSPDQSGPSQYEYNTDTGLSQQMSGASNIEYITTDSSQLNWGTAMKANEIPQQTLMYGDGYIVDTNHEGVYQEGAQEQKNSETNPVYSFLKSSQVASSGVLSIGESMISSAVIKDFLADSNILAEGIPEEYVAREETVESMQNGDSQNS